MRLPPGAFGLFGSLQRSRGSRRSPFPTRTVIDRRYVSSIPGDIIEKTISDYKRDGGLVWLRRAACLLNGDVVGERCYESDGSLVVEIPLSDGNKQGIEYHWYETGELQSAEPYYDGKPHGVAKQWARDGTLMGTYTIEHGTGFDLWRDCLEDGLIFVSEVHSLRDGLPHGFEWWFYDDQRSVWIERHWIRGKLHGIEREWNEQHRLRRGWPRYFVGGERVNKRQYLRAAKQDSALPRFDESDNLPERHFPVKLRQALRKT